MVFSLVRVSLGYPTAFLLFGVRTLRILPRKDGGDWKEKAGQDLGGEKEGEMQEKEGREGGRRGQVRKGRESENGKKLILVYQLRRSLGWKPSESVEERQTSIPTPLENEGL